MSDDVTRACRTPDGQWRCVPERDLHTWPMVAELPDLPDGEARESTGTGVLSPEDVARVVFPPPPDPSTPCVCGAKQYGAQGVVRH